MIAPALVDGRPLSHPDHDPIWRAFVEHGVTPVFHVADQRRVFDDVWYSVPDDGGLPPLESIFLWTAAALACTDLILNGTLERLPELRIGIVELSAIWVPMFLMMLDGGTEFTTRLNGRPVYPLRDEAERVLPAPGAVSSFSYELPGRLIRQTGDLYMCCSDYPHSEGTATPLADYDRQRKPVRPVDAPGLFGENISMLLTPSCVFFFGLGSVGFDPRQASRCDNEYMSSRKRMSSGDANMGIPKAVDDDSARLGSLHAGEEVVDPLVDVEVDGRASEDVHVGPFEVPAEAARDARELRGVLLERCQDSGLAVVRTGKQEVHVHECLADASPEPATSVIAPGQ